MSGPRERQAGWLVPVLTIGLFLAMAAGPLAARTWTDDLNRTWEGDFVRVQGLSAVFLVNGREFSFPVARLCTADKLLIFKLRQKTPAAPSAAPGPAVTLGKEPSAASGMPSAEEALAAYNAAFLVRSEGKTYYKKSVTNVQSTGTWVLALEIQLAEDAAEHAPSGAHRQLVSELLANFLAKENYDWSKDTWNDDVEWMMIACIRGYQITHDTVLLNRAATAWKMVYARGWDDTFGGGIWEEMQSKFSKCALSNDPMIIAGCALYTATKDATYLTRCEGIYAWVHDHIFDAATGQVNEAIARDGKQVSDNVYNSGAFINAANCLHNLTGKADYYQDAVRAADHVVQKNPILSHDARGDNCWEDQFARGLSNLCRDNNLWGRYRSWFLANAKAAWNARRPDLNVTWNAWNTPTPKDDDSSFECLGAAVLQQVMPPPGD